MTYEETRTELLAQVARVENAYDGAVTEMTDNITKMGAEYAVKWADKAMKAQAKLHAHRTMESLLVRDTAIDAVAAELQAAALAKLSYLIPSNSDNAYRIYEAQAYAELSKELKSWARHVD